MQRHPFFDGMDWEHLYSTQPPYRPSVAHELDTQVRARADAHCMYKTTPNPQFEMPSDNMSASRVCQTCVKCRKEHLSFASLQNFEVFEEDPNSSRGGRSTRRADPHFIGYTFKNWEVTAAVRGAAAEAGIDPHIDEPPTSQHVAAYRRQHILIMSLTIAHAPG